jgi:hypothetical protein
MTTVTNVSEDILKSINKNQGLKATPTGTEKIDSDITTNYDLTGGAWVRVPLKLTVDKLEVDTAKSAELAKEAYKAEKNTTWKGGASKTPKRRRRAGKSKSLRRKPKTA